MTGERTTTRSVLGERRGRSLQVAVALGVLLMLAFLKWPALFSTVEQIGYDSANRFRANPPTIDDTVIVAIDDASLAREALGRFPWPRRHFAQILDHLAGARAVGCDVLFLEPDGRDPEGDRLLAEAIARAGNVVLPADLLPAGGRTDDATERAAALQPLLAQPSAMSGPIIAPDRFLPPLPELTAAARGVGFANLVEDGDGRYRRFLVGYGATDGRLYPNFAVEVARVAAGRTPEEFYGTLPGALAPSEERRVPLQAGKGWIHFAGPASTVPTYSAWDIHEGRVRPDAFEGKVVLIGATAAGLYDIRPAPYRGAGGRMFGVEVNANAANSILAAPVLRSEPAWTVCVSLVALALAGCWLMWTRSVVGGTVAFAVLLLAVIEAFIAAFWWGNTILALGPRLAAVLLPASVALADRLLAESRMRLKMIDAFAAYVAPEVAQRLARDPEALGLGGARRNVTVMFTDIRGFTTISEEADPQELLEQMTEYFTAMVGAVFRFGGLVDKFIGDGVMALWGCFDDDDGGEGPRQAVLAATMMRQVLPRLNERWAQEGKPSFRIGIAIHAGSAIVGNMGSERKWNYTATGDTVNTAARIEELCKAHKERWEATILISDVVADAVRDTVELERIGEMPIRGRKQAIGVHAIVGLRKREKEGANADASREEADNG